MWRDILLANRNELLAQSKLFKDMLLSMEALIENSDGDALEALIDQASATRETNRRIATSYPGSWRASFSASATITT